MLEDVINFTKNPINDANFTEECRKELEQKGVVTLHSFLKPETIKELVREAKSHSGLAYFTNPTHNVYLTPRNENLSPEHVFNRQLTSSKGCITTDQIPESSKLKQLYIGKANLLGSRIKKGQGSERCVLLPLQSTKDITTTIDIGRHKQRVMYA